MAAPVELLGSYETVYFCRVPGTQELERGMRRSRV
jgi:hypothetical protein